MKKQSYMGEKKSRSKKRTRREGLTCVNFTRGRIIHRFLVRVEDLEEVDIWGSLTLAIV